MTIIYEFKEDVQNYSSLDFLEDDSDFSASNLIKIGDSKIDINNLGDVPAIYAEVSDSGFHVNDRNDLPLGDTAWLFAGFIVLSRKARKILSPTLENHGVFLPFHCKGCGELNYSLFYPTRIVDALDKDKSKFKQFLGGNIYQISKAIFKEGLTVETPIFKLPNYKGTLFVTDTFIEIIQKEQLTGFDCSQLWPDPNSDKKNERQMYLEKRLNKRRTKTQ